MTVELVLLAMVAAFLGLRLYSVLGKRTGHEQEESLGHSVDSRPAAAIPNSLRDLAPPSGSQPDETADVLPLDAGDGLRLIIQADRQFDLGQFVEGAKQAYKMVLEAYWQGNQQMLDMLCDTEVASSFRDAIAGRAERGEVLENRLVRIDRVKVINVEYDAPHGRITLLFDADIAALIRDRNGNMIGGSLSDAVETHDVWTFSRDMKSRDPNWKLVETDVA